MPAQFTIYRSSDVGAPTLSGTAGDLVNLLDKCLVTGYGAKAAAGWSKPFTGANKAAFKLGAGTGLYLRVDDSAASTAKEARVTGYISMTSVDAGTGPFPTAAQGVGGTNAYFTCRKSVTANGTARDWIVLADSRTFYLFVLTGDTASTYYAIHFGDIYSFKLDDAFQCLLIARNLENDPNSAVEYLATSVAVTGSIFGTCIARGHTQLGASVQVGKHGDRAKVAGNLYFVGVVPMTNPEDGAIYLSQVWVTDPTTLPAPNCRGRMRGLWVPLHPFGSFTDGDTFSGGATGELTGKTFLAIQTLFGGGGSNSTVIMETSATLETN